MTVFTSSEAANGLGPEGTDVWVHPLNAAVPLY
jgi:hypothetical protein